MIDITDINDNRIKFYRSLRKTVDSHNVSNVFIGEGKKVCQKILAGNIKIISFFALEKYYRILSNLIDKRVPGDRKFTASKELMNAIVGFRLHEGIMVIAEQPPFTGIEGLGSRIVAMNGIINSENVGAIVRNCAAFGFNSIIFDSKTSSPYLRRAVRVSMGSVTDMNVHRADKLPLALDVLKSKGYTIIAVENNPAAEDVREVNFPEKFVLIFGTESKGIDEDIPAHCDRTVRIPISDAIPSINVAASSAVLLYEAGKFPGSQT